MATHAAPVEQTTELALQEKRKLVKSLGHLDMVFFTVCAIVGLDLLGQVSGYGAQTFTWVVVLVVLFMFPYALLMAELGTAFPQEGGPYEWMKLSWGRLAAGIGAVLYWVTNPFWVGGSLCFAATSAWSANIGQIGSAKHHLLGITFYGTWGDYLFKFIFIWLSIGVAIASLRRGKWIPNAGALCRFVVLGLFSVTVVIYAFEHGLHGYGIGDFKPTTAVFIGLVPLLIFGFVGFELQNGAAEEMQDAQRDVPRSVAKSAVISSIAYGIPILGIVTVLPESKISGIAGFMDAVHQTFSVYGGAQNFLTDLMALGFIFALVTSGAVWMMGSDRIQAVAGYDGAFIGWFGVFSERFGTPVRVNVLSGITSTIFMVAAVNLLSSSQANTFAVVLYMAISTTLVSYLLIFPALIKLRLDYPDVPRVFRVPGGNLGMWAVGVICTLWTVLGCWVAIFPDTLERRLGAGYDFVDAWGVSQTRFEVFTLGTLAIVIGFGVIGYLLGKPVRDRSVDVPLAPATAGD
jgi:glutamate:GABA antiporter